MWNVWDRWKMYTRENLKERDQFENSRLKVEDNIKLVLKEKMGQWGLDLFGSDRKKVGALLNKVVKLWVL